jgi:hypothetical protein
MHPWVTASPDRDGIVGAMDQVGAVAGRQAHGVQTQGIVGTRAALEAGSGSPASGVLLADRFGWGTMTGSFCF